MQIQSFSYVCLLLDDLVTRASMPALYLYAMPMLAHVAYVLLFVCTHSCFKSLIMSSRANFPRSIQCASAIPSATNDADTDVLATEPISSKHNLGSHSCERCTAPRRQQATPSRRTYHRWAGIWSRR